MSKSQKAAQSQETSERVVGKVVKLVPLKGFGFIQDAAGTEYFFHRSAVRGVGFETLALQQAVNFEVTQGEKGMRAEDVQVE